MAPAHDRRRLRAPPEHHEGRRPLSARRGGVDYYALLGVEPKASQEEIASAYRRLAARYHPDKHQGNELEDLAKEKLTQLNEAYGVLSSPEKRARYDADRLGGAGPGFAGPGRAAAPRPRTGSPLSALRGLAVVALLIAAVPFLLRFTRSPSVMAAIGAALAIAWFGPRIYRWLSRRR